MSTTTTDTAWRLAHRHDGAIVLAVAHTGATLYAGTTRGVAARTGAQEWEWVAPDLPPVFDLAVGRDGTGYAATSHGVYTGDGPGRWTQRLRFENATAIALQEGRDGDLVLVGSASDGIARSVDGGRTWRTSNAGLVDVRVDTLASSPQDDLCYAGTPSGLYVSRNGCVSWTFVTGIGDRPIVGVAASPNDVATILTSDGELLTTADGGYTWEAIALDRQLSVDAVHPAGDGLLLTTGDHGVVRADQLDGRWITSSCGTPPGGCLTVSAEPSGRVVAGGRKGIFGHDGHGWSTLGSPHGAGAPGLLQAGSSPQRVYWATWDGLTTTVDSGDTWIDVETPDPFITGVAADDTDAPWISTPSGVYRRCQGDWSAGDPRGTSGVLLHQGEAFAITAAGGLVVSPGESPPATQWRETPGPPDPVRRLISWGPNLVALCGAAGAAPPRQSIWIRAGVGGSWLPLLSARSTGPVSLAADERTLAVAAGTSVIQFRGAVSRPYRAVDLAECTAVTDLTVCGDLLVVATDRSMQLSHDAGLSWHQLEPPGQPVVSVVADSTTIIALDSTSRVWVTSAQRPATPHPAPR